MTDNKNVDYNHPEDMPLSVRLTDLFDWDQTTQGFEYWSAVYDNLREIEESNK